MELQKLYAEGDKYTQGLEIDRISALLSGALGIDASKRQASATRAAGKSSSMGQIGSAAITKSSDRRLKENIFHVGKSPSGLNIYQFNYKDKLNLPKGTYQGVMADEVPEHAVTRKFTKHNYKAVDYSKIDVDFKQVK